MYLLDICTGNQDEYQVRKYFLIPFFQGKRKGFFKIHFIVHQQKIVCLFT